MAAHRALVAAIVWRVAELDVSAIGVRSGRRFLVLLPAAAEVLEHGFVAEFKGML